MSTEGEVTRERYDHGERSDEREILPRERGDHGEI